MFFKCAVFYLISSDGITGSVLFNNICVLLQKESWQKCFDYLQESKFFRVRISVKRSDRERGRKTDTARETEEKREREKERKGNYSLKIH